MGQKRNTETKPGCCGCVDQGRRQSVGLLLAAGLAMVVHGREAGATEGLDSNKMPPQPGDELVFVSGDRRYEAITVADLAEPDTLLEAWPKDPATDTVRRRSRLNRVLLLRLDPASLDEATAAQAIDGVMAYSAFCTHAGCFIENYQTEGQVIFCHCHNSMFDPRANGKVVGGPAQAPLARLPIRLDGERLLVAGSFQGLVGIKQT